MNFFSKIKAVFSQRFDEMIKAYMSGDDFGPPGFNVMSEENAMKYSALFACFRVLAETFASVPIFEYRKTSDSDREKTDATGLYDVLHTVANEEMSAYNLKESLMYQLCAGGNAVAQRVYNRYDETIGLYPLEWQKLEIKRNKETKRLLYEYRDGNDKRVFQRSNVLHIPGPSVNGLIGMSIIEYAASAIKLGRTYEQFGQNYFENGVFTTGIFEHPGNLKEIPYERLKKQIEENHEKMVKKGKPIIAEDGMKFTPVTLKLVDAQIIEARKLQIEDICRFCRVPLHLVQNLDKATNNNIEHQSLEFVMYTMLPHFKRAEECINAQLLTRNQRKNGYYFEFNISSLLRGDQKSMAEAFAQGRQWGWLSVNDIRRLLNMNSIGTDGDIYLQPMNMVRAGTIIEPKPDKKLLDEIQQLIETGR